jgi:FkbM family methyltransferase
MKLQCTALYGKLKRTTETLRVFSNWPTVLTQTLLTQTFFGKNGKGAKVVTFATRDGLRITCPNSREARSPVYDVFAEGCYQLPWFLAPFGGRPIHAIDIGGHIGAFACQLAQLYPAATIESFEASPVTATYLRDNVAQNGFGDRISVSQVALAAESGWAFLEDNGEASCENSLAAGQDGEQSATTIKVPALSFDDVVGASPHPVDFVKIDCEGAEYDLAYASSPASWKSVDRVVLEYHPVSGHSWSELSKWFAQVGLDVVRHEPWIDQPGLGLAWLARSESKATDAPSAE